MTYNLWWDVKPNSIYAVYI